MTFSKYNISLVSMEFLASQNQAMRSICINLIIHTVKQSSKIVDTSGIYDVLFTKVSLKCTYLDYEFICRWNSWLISISDSLCDHLNDTRDIAGKSSNEIKSNARSLIPMCPSWIIHTVRSFAVSLRHTVQRVRWYLIIRPDKIEF